MWAASSCAAACCATCACEACKSVAGGISRRSARFAYVALFALSLLLTWIVRDFAEPLLEELHWIDTFHFLHIPPKEWFQLQAVLRMSFASFSFFALLSLLLANVTDEKDVRDSWHHGGWMLKLISLTLLTVVAFLLPDAFFSFYGQFARFTSSIFLFLQVVILLDFVYSWNHSWASKDEDRWYMAMLVVSLACYLAAIAGAVLLLLWFVPSGHGCDFNLSFILITLLSAVVVTVTSLHPMVNGSLLPSGVISAYCTYLCWAALSSEPRAYECNGLAAHLGTLSGSRLVFSALLTLFSVAYSALRAGSSTAIMSKSGEEPLLDFSDDESESSEMGGSRRSRPVKYSYSFFHLIFALAATYSAMMLTGWGVSLPAKGEEDIIDVGWGSVWVKFGQMSVTVLLYLWSLVAPLVFPDREFR